jgi:hypothetical protein
VSKDALADFELAAMGTRTVFDSAFDTIVRVDYLGFTQARALLNRRVIDLPEQFAALAYVVSGGLARELARTAEEIGDDRVGESRELGSVTAHLVRRQLSRTTRAAADLLSRDRGAGRRPHPRPGRAPARRHHRGRVAHLRHPHRGHRAHRWRARGGGPHPGRRRGHGPLPGRAGAIVRQRPHRGTHGHRRVRGLGDFETLARVRRYLGANPHGAQELLTAFAKAWGLPTGRGTG